MTKVLVVDDATIVRTLVTRALTSEGFTVVQACNGVEALAQLAATPDIGLVVCDVNMPKMSGLEFLEALTPEQKKQASVLMLTTETHSEIRDRARALGARGWLVKPFKAETLLAAAKKLTASGGKTE